jgi:serine/threonine protein kinase
MRGSREHSSDHPMIANFEGGKDSPGAGTDPSQRSIGTYKPPAADVPSTGGEPVTPQADFAPAPATGDTLPPPDGRILFNKYLLLRELGAGGMGKVYLVRHLKLDTDRALKTIDPQISSNPEWRRRFGREAKAMARLSHPHIVAVHDADVLPEGDAFIEMEYVRGQSLDKRLKPEVPMSLAWVDQVLGQLCDALQVAHDMEIVHRDLKPHNLMLQDGQCPGRETLKILDFGIAKILNSEDPGDNVTQLGQSMGTPLYMSPEQIRGDNEAVNARSDIYSLGVILYQLLTGYLPFAGGRNQVFIGHLCNPPPTFCEKNPEVHVPAEVEALVLRCLEKDPKRRPESASALAAEFHRLVAPTPEPLPPIRTHWARRGAWLALAGVIAIGVGVPLQRLIRSPSRGIFTVTTDSSSLEVVAGGEAQLVRLQFTGCEPGTKVDVTFPDPHADVTIKQVGTFFGDFYEFQVAADLNARPTPEPIELKLRVSTSHDVRESSIPLRIASPRVAPLPAGFREAEGAQLRRLANDKIYPSRIVRRLSGRLDVVFLLIGVETSHIGPTSSFYIMENKVWNELYDAYLKDQPERAQERARDHVQQREARQKEFGLWPVFSITPQEARKFADWLVPRSTLQLTGDLPTCEQWDKAAGFYDRESKDSEHEDRGPFLRGWSPSAMDQIAIHREKEGPLPVGTATKDLSRFGCRDMSGNGMEWTRPLEKLPSAVDLRGRKFSDHQPFFFEDRGLDSELGNKPKSWIGFRVVIEGL